MVDEVEHQHHGEGRAHDAERRDAADRGSRWKTSGMTRSAGMSKTALEIASDAASGPIASSVFMCAVSPRVPPRIPGRR